MTGKERHRGNDVLVAWEEFALMPTSQSYRGWLELLDGWFSPDVYSTAWIALVPDVRCPERPAWPQALDFLRCSQLVDGGWGEPSVFYAHERTVATLAAIRALDRWGRDIEDRMRVVRGLDALRRYAPLLKHERHEPIGFELLLPRVWRDLAPLFQSRLPVADWTPIEALNRDKLALIMNLHPHVGEGAAWWFSMEMLPEEYLAAVDDSILEPGGSIATSPAATAAYLWAQRRAGRDSPRAAMYLNELVRQGDGAVPFCYPAENFERLWVLDSLRRAGTRADSPVVRGALESIWRSWESNTQGMSFSDRFPVNDGDTTSVGLTVLQWGGYRVDHTPLLPFWDSDHIRSYVDERGVSVSANVHALMAFRSQPNPLQRVFAERLTKWLVGQMISTETLFEDKWHYSPFYAVSRAVPAFLGWHESAAQRCVKFLLEHQRSDGGWGWFADNSTLEETGLCVLALVSAYKVGDYKLAAPLVRAADHLAARNDEQPHERLWIGKTLYRSDAIVWGTLYAARVALQRLASITGLQELAPRLDMVPLESWIEPWRMRRAV